MPARLGGSQISSLLESVPGIASVLRSPVADAIVNMVRSGAGLEPFDKALAKELVQYAVRRGLLPISEGDELLAEIETAGKKRKGRSAAKAPTRKKSAAKPKAKRPAATARKTAVKKVAKKKKTASPAAKKSTKTTARKKATKPARKSSVKKRR